MLYFQCHQRLLEATEDDRQILVVGLQYLVHISYVDDVEVFKTCLEYWNHFVMEIYSTAVTRTTGQMNYYNNHMGGWKDKRSYFDGILSQLRTLMLCRMAKPEEVIKHSVI